MATTATQPPVTAAIAAAAVAWGQAALASGSLGYDPAKFYCKATDVKGHGERVSYKLPPDVYAQIMKLCYGIDFPDYESPPDFLRDAAVHHLARRMDQIGDPRMREVTAEIMSRLAYEEYVAKITNEAAKWERAHDDFREVLTKMYHIDAWGQIVGYIDFGEEFIDPAPEPHRSRGMAVMAEWKLKVPAEFRPVAWGLGPTTG